MCRITISGVKSYSLLAPNETWRIQKCRTALVQFSVPCVRTSFSLRLSTRTWTIVCLETTIRSYLQPTMNHPPKNLAFLTSILLAPQLSRLRELIRSRVVPHQCFQCFSINRKCLQRNVMKTLRTHRLMMPQLQRTKNLSLYLWERCLTLTSHWQRNCDLTRLRSISAKTKFWGSIHCFGHSFNLRRFHHSYFGDHLGVER